MTNALVLTRIAEALERLAPPPPPPMPDDAPAYRWQAGALCVVESFCPTPLHLLSGIDAQKIAVIDNGRRLAAGHAAHDVLLWGARGSGKSALTKSAVAALQAEGAGLCLVEVAVPDITSLPTLLAALGRFARPSIVFIDDLSFDDDFAAARHLRSVLDGGVAARPPHVRIYVTSNRRHILPRSLEEQESAINPRDVIDDKLALVDRFGLSLGFHVCDQNQYLAMVAGYAAHLGLPFDAQDALLWSAQRGARSGRVAWHYANELAGRAGQTI
jgi:uncharacterized protein